MDTNHTRDNELTNLVPPDLTLYLVKSNWTDMIVAAFTPEQAKEFLHGYVNYLRGLRGDLDYYISSDSLSPNYYDIEELHVGSRPTILYSSVKSKYFDYLKENNDD